MKVEELVPSADGGVRRIDLALAVVHVLPQMFIDEGLLSVGKTDDGGSICLWFGYEQDQSVSLVFKSGNELWLSGGCIELVMGSSLTTSIQKRLADAQVAEADDLFAGLTGNVWLELELAGATLADCPILLESRSPVSWILGPLLYAAGAVAGEELLELIVPAIEGLRERHREDTKIGEFDE